VPPRSRKGNEAEPLGFEDVLWKAADKLRGSMDSSEYKHVILGLIFLKYVEDAFEERRGNLRGDLEADSISPASRPIGRWSPATSTPMRACFGCRRRLAGATCRSRPSSPRSASSSTTPWTSRHGPRLLRSDSGTEPEDRTVLQERHDHDRQAIARPSGTPDDADQPSSSMDGHSTFLGL
jgi:hypothetical protein